METSSPSPEMELNQAEDLHLRHVEKDVLIPKIMREKARERCSDQVQELDFCSISELISLAKKTKDQIRNFIKNPDPIHMSFNLEHIFNFTKCCKDSGFLMVVKCRKENSALKECLIAHYKNPDFYEECKMEYLKEREEFRKTGIRSKNRLQKLPTNF